MTSSNGHHGYDEDLLASAPAPTKGMVQSGYATDLLVDKPKPSRRGDIESGPHRSYSSKHASTPNGAKATADARGASNTSIPTKFATKPPFYRTKRGMIILAIVAIALLAAIIGGAVGGSLASKKRVDVTQVPTANHSGDSIPASSIEVGRPTDVVNSTLSTQSPGVAVSVVRVTTTVDPTPSPRLSVVSPPGPSGSPGSGSGGGGGGGVIPVPTLTF